MSEGTGWKCCAFEVWSKLPIYCPVLGKIWTMAHLASVQTSISNAQAVIRVTERLTPPGRDPMRGGFWALAWRGSPSGGCVFGGWACKLVLKSLWVRANGAILG